MEVVLFTVVMVVEGIKIQTEADRIMVQMVVRDTKIPMVAVLFMMRMVVGGIEIQMEVFRIMVVMVVGGTKMPMEVVFLWRNGRQ